MFELIPCVDIQNGKAVRLFEGDPAKETIYFQSPLEAAKHWQSLGAKRLHLVDLDAAIGTGNNKEIIKDIANNVDTKIEIGGGIRSFEVAKEWLKSVDQIVLGTIAITKPEIVENLVKEFDPEKIIISIDARDGLVAVKGWQEYSNISAIELAERSLSQGIKHIIYTDISRDGTLQGVNPEPVIKIRESFPHKIVAGGGVASDNDIKIYKDIGLEGAIVGRALYEGTITYPQ